MTSPQDDDFEALLESSSLGGPAARRLRGRTPRSQARAVRRIAELRTQIEQPVDEPEAVQADRELQRLLKELGYRTESALSHEAHTTDRRSQGVGTLPQPTLPDRRLSESRAAASKRPAGGSGELSPLHAPTIATSEGSTARVDEEFAAFYRRTVSGLVAYLINMGAAAHVAADVAQDTMLEVYRRWADIHDPRSWVYKVAGRSLVRELARTEETDQTPAGPGTSLMASTELDEDIQQLEVQRVLQSLPPRQRQVLALTLADFSTSEISTLLGLHPPAVRGALARARRTLADRLGSRESNDWVRRWE
ncbi:sigma-70 family RNA polymerase sigma factor [Streptomyces sp. NBC_00481]|uniref:RNA polymerase sigma factor n=1 Tax=Streptomyces sp. NBC_00481 TaxID=2975755 RepID=UPI002DDA4914|nr:sigma-70 family RNA polymerase sigma factor [Streptomyces sp. NBC_00481]WRZ01206.1 sigma-70 family RNA polymerase sigma factor [Streptomyces sp. NBC_00481]